MAKDRSNQSMEPVTVRKPMSGRVPMTLPRSDDGTVHAASGERLNSSAAHYADAAGKVIGGAAAGKRKFSQGG